LAKKQSFVRFGNQILSDQAAGTKTHQTTNHYASEH